MRPVSEWVTRNVDEVIDPVAERYAGRPLNEVRSALRSAWRAVFGVDLDEVTLGEIAAAIHGGREWRPAMWRAYWAPRVRAEAGIDDRKGAPSIPRQRGCSEWSEFDPTEHRQ